MSNSRRTQYQFMIDLCGTAIEPDEIVCYLKRDIQLKQVCQNILSQKIIDRAALERGIAVTPEEIQAEGDRLRREKGLEKAWDTLSWLAQQMISVEDLEAGIRQKLLAQKLAEYLFASEVEKLFVQNRLDFDQILLYKIVVPDEKLAREIFYRIEEQEISFYQAAHLYDIEEGRRRQYGYEGQLYRWNLKPDVAAVVFSTQREAIGPFRTESDYQILMVEEFIPAELTPLRYQDILNQMFREWLAGELNYLLHSQTG